MTWFTYSILSIFALATAELVQQHLLNLKKSFDERSSGVLTFFVQALFTIPIIIFSPLKSELLIIFNPKILPLMLLVNFIAAIAMTYYLRSFKVQNISISTIFVSFSVVVSTILGIIFNNEGLYFLKILGIALVLFSIFSINLGKFKLEKNQLYGLLAGVLFGISYTFDKNLVQHMHPFVYIFWSFFFVALLGYLMGIKTVNKAVKNADLGMYVPIVISGLGYFLYNFFTFSAYKVGGEVGRIDAINNSQIFLIILFEYFILAHRKNFGLKIFAALVAFCGVFILGNF